MGRKLRGDGIGHNRVALQVQVGWIDFDNVASAEWDESVPPLPRMAD